jgi:hypothetical protein
LVTVGEMIIPVPALPLLFQITVADGVPEWDVTSSCRAAAAATQAASTEARLKGCIDSEHRTRDKLASEWSTFPAPDQIRCINAIKWFSPTYTELASCLERNRDSRKAGETKSR